MISEDNVKKQIQMPWVTFGSDADAPAAEGVFLVEPPSPHLRQPRQPSSANTFARSR